MINWPDVSFDAKYGPNQNESIRDIHSTILDQTKAVVELMETHGDDFALQVMGLGTLLRGIMGANTGLVMLTQALRDVDKDELDAEFSEAKATVSAVHIMHRHDVDSEIKELLS